MTKTAQKLPLLSIIIPVRNEARLLTQCLASLKNQRTAYPYEILIVDTNSTDTSLDIANRYHTTVISEPKRGKVYAFITGAKKARGDILCFTEADCVLPPNWLQTIGDYLTQNPQVIAVSSDYDFHSSTWLYQTLAAVVHPITRFIYWIMYRSTSFRGTNFAITKTGYQKIGGFSRRYFELYDVELGIRASKIGTIHHLSNMRVQTSDRRIRGRILPFLSEFFPSFIMNIIVNRPINKQLYKDVR